MASELASIVQSTHIQHQPSIEHDLNPSTAASKTTPASLISPREASPDYEDDLDAHSATSSSSSDTFQSDILRPIPRPKQPANRLPLPDLRFEQTYLASIKNAETYGAIAYITVRDQVLLPLVQGVGYHLLISGWRFWNRGSKFSGQTLGARVRKWWWGVNGWRVPGRSGG